MNQCKINITGNKYNSHAWSAVSQNPPTASVQNLEFSVISFNCFDFISDFQFYTSQRSSVHNETAARA